MNKLTVNVPTGRPAVARHTLQISLNRSVPAVTDEDIDRSLFTYPSSSSQKNRVNPTMASSTNEFGTRTPKGGPQSRGSPAGAKIVDFGRNVELQPRGKFNVRGVGVGGFFPPVKLRTGTSGVRFSTSAGSTRSCKSAIHSSPAPSPLNVELAPSKTSRTAGESDRLDASSMDRDWSPTTSRSENLARTHTLQDRPGNPYNTRAAASRETLSVKESSPSPSPQAFKSGNNHATTGSSKSGTPDQQRASKDAAWVRSFKVKQRRNNRVKELMESKPAGLALTSPTNMGSSVW
ncbi:uncharacterized protein [Asterias amurensis]|uniref:uncharacterized protein n=1 Tax=Asterias amurensis TaxID=7602 RepID=UPI003AB5FCDA